VKEGGRDVGARGRGGGYTRVRACTGARAYQHNTPWQAESYNPAAVTALAQMKDVEVLLSCSWPFSLFISLSLSLSLSLFLSLSLSLSLSPLFHFHYSYLSCFLHPAILLPATLVRFEGARHVARSRQKDFFCCVQHKEYWRPQLVLPGRAHCSAQM
jgi:hypothetical protein